MRNLILIFVIALVASFSASAQYTDYLQQGISLQDGCNECPKNYKLYDGVRFTFFGGEIITMTQFRQVAALIGAVLGIEYNQGATNNIAILHARLTPAQFNSILATVGGTADSIVIASNSTPKNGVVNGGVEKNDNTEAAFSQSGDETASSNIDPVQLDTTMVLVVGMTRIEMGVDSAAALVSEFSIHERLIDVWVKWAYEHDAADYRAARFAIKMAFKYGGYEDAPVRYDDGYKEIEQMQQWFAREYGHDIPFLGFNEGDYIKYYGYKPPVKGGGYYGSGSVSMSRVKSRAHSVSVAASHAACRKTGRG